MIDIKALREINYIIEHDVVSSTYKYVLLKSTINTCQRFDHLINYSEGRAFIPLGLLVKQWIFDYMPFVFKRIAQQNNGNILDTPIQTNYQKIFSLLNLDPHQEWEYAYMQFTKAFENPKMSQQLSQQFLQLSKKIATKIVMMPMRYIGKSEHGIFRPERFSFGDIHLIDNMPFNAGFLTHSFGYFSISKEHHDIFYYLGQSLYGSSTIMTKWKEKTLALSEQETMARDMIDKLSSDSLENRDTSSIRKNLSEEKICVWSGVPLTGNSYDVDHVLPFSVWFNNDLWNMLPTNRQLNQQKKKHKIPTPQLVEARAESITSYWEQYMLTWPIQFKRELELALTGPDLSQEKLYDAGIEALCKKCHYLIYDRGHEAFSG